MSLFLIYFERNDPLADWKNFRLKRESIRASFDMTLAKHGLVFSEIDMLVSESSQRGFVFSDGFSSNVFLKRFKKNEFQLNDLFLQFLRRRLETKTIVPWFTLQLIHTNLNQPLRLFVDAVNIETVSIVNLKERRLLTGTNYVVRLNYEDKME